MFEGFDLLTVNGVRLRRGGQGPWFFLPQPEPFPEQVIASGEAFYFRGDRSRFHPGALTEYLAAVHNPSVIHRICQDYRAGATVDHQLDEADLAAGNRVRCPVLVLWAGHDELGRWFDVLETWRSWADDVRRRAIDCGHFLAEEKPAEITEELRSFLKVR